MRAPWELRPHDRSRCAEHRECDCALRSVVHVPRGVVMLAPSTLVRNAGAQSERPRQGGCSKSAAKGSIKAGARKPRLGS
jgi:hypothetical protein